MRTSTGREDIYRLLLLIAIATPCFSMPVQYGLSECNFGADTVAKQMSKQYSENEKAIEDGLPNTQDPKVFVLLAELKGNFNLFERIVASRPVENKGDTGVPFEFKYLSHEMIEVFSQRPDILKEFITQTFKVKPESLDYFVENYQVWAKSLLAVEFVLKKRMEVTEWSLEDFKQLAELEGFTPKVYSELYRMDSRSPETILKQQGFHTRNQLTTISVHSHRESLGTSYISLTTAKENASLLKVDPILNAAVSINEFKSQKVADATADYKATGVLFELRTYEYRVKDVLGVSPKEHASIEREMEIVSPQISVDQITEYRVVEFAVDRALTGAKETHRELVAYEYGEWQAMPE
ncbi:hypothetical protein N9D31_02075 [Oligoflexaceae bacterium]|nr:hypothetical protein [Oligoflexaceae bacterium]